VWAEATAVSSYMRGVNSTYRLCAVRISSAFRTISDDAALFIARQVPLCELVREAKEIRAALAGEKADRSTKTEVKRRARMQSVVNWQAAWDNSSMKHGLVDFYLTQAQSGHGCFRSFLKRFGHDTEEHVLLNVAALATTAKYSWRPPGQEFGQKLLCPSCAKQYLAVIPRNHGPLLLFLYLLLLCI